MKTSLAVGLFVVALGFIVAAMSVFTVHETEQALVLQFGNPVTETALEPGLHFKIPFIQQVRRFDKRILSVDPAPERVNLSSDRNSPLRSADNAAIVNDNTLEVSGEPVLVDTFARYKITDPLLFLQRLRTEAAANQRIENVMDAATRDVLGRRTLRSLLSTQRGEIMNEIRRRVNADMESRGVEIVDIRIVRADLTERLRTSTVNRMITERQERAAETRAKGQAAARRIRAEADKQEAVILAEAERDAQIIRGEGDNTAIQTYANAFNKDEDFYAFMRSMEAYRNTLADPETQLILSPDSDFFKFFSDLPQK